MESGVPDNLRGCWSRLYPKASRSKYQSITMARRWVQEKLVDVLGQFVDGLER